MNEVVSLPLPVHSEAGNPTREIRLGVAIAVAFFVLFLGWAAFVPLDAGVNAGQRVGDHRRFRQPPDRPAQGRRDGDRDPRS